MRSYLNKNQITNIEIKRIKEVDVRRPAIELFVMNSSDRLDLRRHFRGKYQTERRFGTDLRGHLLFLLLFLLHSGNGACEIRNAIDCERIAESYLRPSIAQHFETERSERDQRSNAMAGRERTVVPGRRCETIATPRILLPL